MNPDGTGQTRLTDNSDEDNLPSFSPDGTKIAFSSRRDGVQEIYIMDSDGNGQTNLSNVLIAHDFAPSFSSDGTKIAFGSGRDGNAEIYMMNSDGTGQANLTNNGSGDDMYSSFSTSFPSKYNGEATDGVEGTPDRSKPMTCWQVFINEDNMFEFIFWYPYKDNNWVQISDMEGNIVYEVDMPFKDPHIIVDLPNGMYNVKTFHSDPYKDNNWIQISDIKGNLVYEIDLSLKDGLTTLDLPDKTYNIKVLKFDPDNSIQEFVIGKS